MKNIFYYDSPVGLLEIQTENNLVIVLTKVENSMIDTTLILNNFESNVIEQLNEYFNGKRKIFDFSFAPQGTCFQKKVWNELLKIPYGQTYCYQQIAKAIGNKDASRAVGNAINKNPIAIIIPCHRVISKNGNLSGFANGIEMKKYLLNLESTNK